MMAEEPCTTTVAWALPDSGSLLFTSSLRPAVMGPLRCLLMPHPGLTSSLTLSPNLAAALSMRDGNYAF